MDFQPVGRSLRGVPSVPSGSCSPIPAGSGARGVHVLPRPFPRLVRGKGEEHTTRCEAQGLLTWYLGSTDRLRGTWFLAIAQRTQQIAHR